MLKNYIKTAFRNLWHNRFYTSINISGLAISLAVGIIIILWVKDELSYDSFHSKADHIYKVNAVIGSGASEQVWTGIQAPVATFGKREIPEIKNAVRIGRNYNYSLYTYGEKRFSDLNTAFTDPSFFSVFDFKLLEGNKNTIFPDDRSIVISSTFAKKYFGKEEAIGKVIVADNRDNFVVRGVMEDFPENSSIRFDMLFPLSFIAKQYSSGDYWKSMEEDWGNYNCETYVEIQPGSSTTAIENKLTAILKKHHPDAGKNHYTFQPLSNVHLYGADGNSSAMQSVKIFFAVAVLLLVIACINYVNLSTARSMLRAKEVSVRKIIGAARLQLFLQFIVESALLFLLATILAVILIYLLMPLYNSLSDKHTAFEITNPGVWQIISATFVVTLLAASLYPALLLSAFKPLLALKGKLTAGISNVLFRKILVIAQFSFSVILIIGTIVIGSQLHYIHEKELGYDKSHVLTFFMRNMQQHAETIKTELNKIPGVTGVTSSGGYILNIGSSTSDTDWEGKEKGRDFLIHPMGIDADFMKVMKLQMIAGKPFKGGKGDSANIILNETAVNQAGIKDPIGKTFTLWQTKATIIGVVKDFHFASLKQKIEPAAFYYANDGWNIYIRTNGKDAPRAIAAAEKLWKQYNAGFPFNYNFLDESYDKMYKSDQRTGTLFNVFAAIAILVSCLGLFGLATYTAQIKTKEIGIRKVLGASVTGLTGLLAKDFVKTVLVSIVIASPVAWYLMNKWLQDFQYRVNIGWWVFVLAGVLAIAIALLTVSYQSIKAALMSPVKSLRSE